jgi:SAM-dependent methyltransferase
LGARGASRKRWSAWNWNKYLKKQEYLSAMPPLYTTGWLDCMTIANIKPGQHVLEVAVGTGLAFEHVVMENPNGRNVGIDISQGMLSKAERRLRKAGLSNYELSLGSALAIQEQANSFDVLLNNYMFDLLEEHKWTEVLREFHRIIKPEGKLVLGWEAGSTKDCTGFRLRSWVDAAESDCLKCFSAMAFPYI